jgi:hypothetical protein
MALRDVVRDVEDEEMMFNSMAGRGQKAKGGSRKGAVGGGGRACQTLLVASSHATQTPRLL